MPMPCAPTRVNPLRVRPDTILVHVWGRLALFTNPHFRADAYSYPFLGPSPALGMVRALYWKPECEWEVTRIGVCSPLGARLTIKGSGLKTPFQFSAPTEENPTGMNNPERTPQTRSVLRDVSYVIEARLIENPFRPRSGSHLEEARRRMRAFQSYSPLYLGVNEYPARWRFIEQDRDIPATIPVTRSFGRMLFNFVPEDLGIGDHKGFPDKFQPVFFDAHLEDGILNVPSTLWEEHREQTMWVRNRAHVNTNPDAPKTLPAPPAHLAHLSKGARRAS